MKIKEPTYENLSNGQRQFIIEEIEHYYDKKGDLTLKEIKVKDFKQGCGLAGLFTWSNTRQGHDFWQSIRDRKTEVPSIMSDSELFDNVLSMLSNVVKG